jgi:hypothetical protein
VEKQSARAKSRGASGEEKRMPKYEFKLVTLNRYHLREEGSAELAALNADGAEGWHIVVVRDDPRDGSNLVLFLERQAG